MIIKDFYKCSMCEKDKPIGEFYIFHTGGMERRTARCKSCTKIKGLEYHEKHKEERNKKCREYFKNHRDQFREYNEKWKRENPEKLKLVQQKSRLAHPEWQVKHNIQTSKRMREHPEIGREKSRKYRKENPDKVLEFKEARRAREMGAEGVFTEAEWIQMKNETGGRCVYCCKKTHLAMEHVIPLSKGGRHDAENIVPACHSCNSRKSNMPLIIYLYRRALS